MIKPLAGDRDAELARVGEVGQCLGARRVGLPEDNLALRPVQRLPGSNAPLEGPALPQPVTVRIPVLQLLEDRDWPQPRHRLEHRQNIVGPDRAKPVGARDREAFGRFLRR